MRYFVQYGKKNHIIAIGTGAGGTEITKIEYDEIMAIIQNRPSADGKGYRLKADLTWEAYDLPPEPEPSDEDELSDAQALNILLGGATWHAEKQSCFGS